MKALVLTYDENHFLADHMIATYNKLWPDHPFVFHVPYQDNPDQLKNKYRERVEMVAAPRSIIGTIDKLTENIEPNEWVYWAIDDKYLIALDTLKARNYHNWVTENKDTSVLGLVTHRAWALWTTNVSPIPTQLEICGDVLLKRLSWRNFWLHQYYRVKAIRSMIQTFPRDPIVPKEMDGWVRKGIDNKHSLYVIEKPTQLFGESTSNGVLNSRSLASCKRYGVCVPERRMHTIINRDIVYGMDLRRGSAPVM